MTIDRWEYTTPLGLPVVPLVYAMEHASCSSSTGQSISGDASASSDS
jgi:hypothetical protein